MHLPGANRRTPGDISPRRGEIRGPGRPPTFYYLNKPQAIFITTQSGTPTAIEVTVEVIKKFDAYERGTVEPAKPNLIPLHTIEDEPRVLDVELAERLGMAVPRKVRQNIIDAHRDEMEGFGELRMQRIHNGRVGRPEMAYYLNEEQALLVCALSRTERAKEVRAMLIKVFVAWRRGRPNGLTCETQGMTCSR